MIIGFTGYLKSGKTTCAQYLAQHHGFTVRRFAEELNTDCARMLAGMDFDPGSIGYVNRVEELLAQMACPCTKEGFREFLIWYGTAYRRKSDDDYWIKRGWAMPLQKNVAFDNVRMPNEVAELKRLGGILVRVLRPEFKNCMPLFSDEPDLELPETEGWIRTFKPDYLIYNTESIQDTYKQLEKLMASICHQCGYNKCRCGKES